jgi:hypothetical protein
VVIVGEVLMVGDGDGVGNGDPGITASTRVGLATSETFCGGGEWRLETGAASGFDGELEALQKSGV